MEKIFNILKNNREKNIIFRDKIFEIHKTNQEFYFKMLDTDVSEQLKWRLDFDLKRYNISIK